MINRRPANPTAQDPMVHHHFFIIVPVGHNCFLLSLTVVDPESKEWVKFRKIIKDETEIELREIFDKKEKPLLISTPDSKGNTIFIRIMNECSIKYCIVAGNSVGDNAEIHSINVKTREFDAVNNWSEIVCNSSTDKIL